MNGVSDYRAQGVHDPHGYFRSTNAGLAAALVENPHIAKLFRMILDGLDQFVRERGSTLAHVVPGRGFNLRENALVIRLELGPAIPLGPIPAGAKLRANPRLRLDGLNEEEDRRLVVASR